MRLAIRAGVAVPTSEQARSSANSRLQAQAARPADLAPAQLAPISRFGSHRLMAGM